MTEASMPRAFVASAAARVRRVLPSGRLGSVTAARAGHALGLMALRSMTIAAKFALTLFITRYLGLADLGVYGIIASVAALTPVVLGFGVSNNMGREAVRHGPASITPRLVQYFLFLIPAYAVLCVGAMFVWPDRALWLCLLAVLLFLDHLQTEMFFIMTVTGLAYGANVAYFVRFAGWSLLYIPCALAFPQLRNLTAVLEFWLGGCVFATLMTAVLTRRWNWGAAIAALPRSRLRLPHSYGSMGLYVGDMANAVFVYLDRYIVGFLVGPTMLGVYVLYWSIINALNNLIAISVVLVQRGELVKVAHLPRGAFNRRLVRVSGVSMGMALSLGSMATVMMYLVVPHLGRAEVAAYLPLLLILCLALILRTLYEVLGIAFYAYGRDDLILASIVAVLVLALVLNLSLDPRIGLWGAGIALVASYALGSVGRGVMILRGFGRRDAGRAAAALSAPAYAPATDASN